MKHTLITTLTLLFAAPAVLAWPFVERPTGGITDVEAALQGQAFQADPDRVLEYYNGGTLLLQMTAGAGGGGLNAQRVALPLPDTDPYAPNLPISWGLGRGDTGDIDGDGDTDIVYSSLLHYNNGPEDINVRIVACRNNGNGTWTRLWQLKDTTAAVYNAPEVKLGDFDRDGDLDLVETSNGLRVMWNDGTGIFSTATGTLYGAYPTVPGFSETPECEVGDFDGNGWQDIALFANVRLSTNDTQFKVTGRLSILYNQGGGTFTATTVQTNASQVDFNQSAAADVDGDGRLDLLAARTPFAGGSELQWFRNTGSGFAAGVTVLSLTQAQAPAPIAFLPGDLDEDGVTDIVFSTHQGEAQFLRGSGGGSFSTAVMVRAGDTVGPTGIGLADMDGDGDNDLILKSGNTFLENTAPHLRSAASASTFSGTALTGSVDLTTGDVNNDGFEDLIASDGGANRIRWYTGGTSGLTEQVYVSTGSTSPASVAAGDWNGDGWTDLAWSGNSILRQALSTTGTGIGWGFSDAATMTGISGLLASDMDRDGDLDLFSYATNGTLRIHSNNGSASWLPQTVDTGVTGISRIALGQISPGRRPEIAALGSNLVSTWRYGASSWAETPMANPAAGNNSRGLCIADISDTLSGAETVFSLNTNSVFYDHDSLSNPVSIGTLSSPVVQLAPVDWNRDGYTDILVTTTTGISLLVHVRSGEAQFENPPVLLLAFAPGVTLQDTAVLDVNRDNLPDAVIADSTGGLTLLTNTSYAVTSTITASPTRGIAPESPGLVCTFHGTYQSTVPGDAGISPVRLRFNFNRAVGTPGSDVVGTPMTEAEVNALVDFFIIRTTQEAGPVNVGNPSPVSLGSGQFLVDPGSSPAGSIGGYAPEKDYTVQLRLKSTAASAPVTRFFVSLQPAIPWVGAGNSSIPAAVRSRNDSTSQRTLLYVRPASPLEIWRNGNFATWEAYGAAANDADPDGDGMSNLMEYLTGQNPNVRGGIGFSPVVGVSFDAGQDAMVADLRLLTNYDSRVKLTLQYSLNPASSWSLLSTRTGTGAWTGITPYTTTVLSGGRTRFGFDGGFNPAIFKKAFFRLKAEELP